MAIRLKQQQECRNVPSSRELNVALAAIQYTPIRVGALFLFFALQQVKAQR
jgi:hypothetical protein